jgi:hypothetical protein
MYNWLGKTPACYKCNETQHQGYALVFNELKDSPVICAKCVFISVAPAVDRRTLKYEWEK